MAEQRILTAEDGSPVSIHIWEIPAQTPSAVVLIVHGMIEHAERYQWTAETLNSHSINVVALDVRGHGERARRNKRLGHLEPGDWEQVSRDIRVVMDWIATSYPDVPMILFGHSMGSFLAQRAAADYSHLLKGLILSGSAYEKTPLLFAGKFLASVLGTVRNLKTKAPFLQFMTFLGYNKRIKPRRTPFDWLSRDTGVVDAYVADPLCGFVCTYGFYREFYRGIIALYYGRRYLDILTSLPIYIVSGTCDPVGGYAAKVKALQAAYQAHGHPNVTLTLYEGARHEVLNELNKDVVIRDILAWINKVILNRAS